MKKKILVVSDSHGNYTRLNKIIQKELPFDYLIHCGDGVGDLIHVDLPGTVKVLKVAGNIDIGRAHGVESEILVPIRHLNVLILHGHRQHVKSDYDLLLSKGLEHAVDIVFFGHSHLATYVKNKPILFNPGPATNGFYGIVMISDKVDFEHRRVE